MWPCGHLEFSKAHCHATSLSRKTSKTEFMPARFGWYKSTVSPWIKGGKATSLGSKHLLKVIILKWNTLFILWMRLFLGATVSLTSGLYQATCLGLLACKCRVFAAASHLLCFKKACYVSTNLSKNEKYNRPEGSLLSVTLVTIFCHRMWFFRSWFTGKTNPQTMCQPVGKFGEFIVLPQKDTHKGFHIGHH